MTVIKKLYEDWFIEKAQSLFKYKIERYSEKLGVKPGKIIIKNLKNRWGSMTKEGSLNLNAGSNICDRYSINYIFFDNKK